MPNLDHDPKNPTDLLDRPIKEGDIVAWGTTYGRSAGLCVARIEKIRFVRTVYSKRIECRQDEADDYTLSLRPLKSTGSVTHRHIPTGRDVTYFHSLKSFAYWDRSRPEGGRCVSVPESELEAKLKTVQLVKNVVKLEPMA